MINHRKASLLAGLVIGLVALFAVLTAAAEDKPAADPPAGQLLIAASTIQDPRFYHSVILIVRHDADGALGIAINKPIGEKPLAELLADSSDRGAKGPDNGTTNTAIAGKIQVFLGGPVQPQLGFVIHSGDYHGEHTLAIVDGFAMTGTKDVLRDIGRHKGPAKYLFALGYAGWGGGQLEAEIARHDWFTEPAAPDLVFDLDRDAVWEKALARRTREL